MEEILKRLGSKYVVTESENFTIFSEKNYAGTLTRSLREAVEKIRKRVLKGLFGIATHALPKLPIVVLEDEKTYRDYVLSYYPNLDVNAVSTSGVVIQGPGKITQVALPDQDLAITEGLFAHELARLSLGHLELPVWLEEGIVSVFEQEMTGGGIIFPAEDELRELRDCWTPETVGEFWNGSTFYSLDSQKSACSRRISTLLVHAIVTQFGLDRFRAFVLSASAAKDIGEASAMMHLKISLGDLFVATLDIEGDTV